MEPTAPSVNVSEIDAHSVRCRRWARVPFRSFGHVTSRPNIPPTARATAERDWPRISSHVFLASLGSTVSRPAALRVSVPACSQALLGAPTQIFISGANCSGCSHHSISSSGSAVTSATVPLTASQCAFRTLLGHGFKHLSEAAGELIEQLARLSRLHPAFRSCGRQTVRRGPPRGQFAAKTQDSLRFQL